MMPGMKHIASILFILFTAVTAQSVTTGIGNSLFNDGLALDAGGNTHDVRNGILRSQRHRVRTVKATMIK